LIRLLKEWSVYAWDAIVHFLKHMWNGSRLLSKNVSIATGLLGKSIVGKKLIRREERLLLRTISDLGRLIPFSFFILIPFMELLLPVALKVFPNLLPSTFEERGDKHKTMAKTTKTRTELAQEMQEGLMKRLDVLSASDEDGGEVSETSQAATDFKKFISNIRDGRTINKNDITRNARWFKDEFTIDSVSRAQLEAMCTFMGIPTYGADSVLRFQIRHRLRQIQADDRKIWWEGITMLDDDDLIEANHDRGMPHEGYKREKLEAQLARWIDLSMNSAVPPSLLCLSRTFVRTTTDKDTAETGDALRAAIKSIEKEVVEEIEDELQEDILEAVEHEKKKKNVAEEQKSKAEEAAEDLEELKREMALIKEERTAIEEVEKVEKKAEQELEAMRMELAEILTKIEVFNTRVVDINTATLEIVERRKEATFVDNIEQMQDEDDRKKEEASLEKSLDALGSMQDQVKAELLKTSAKAGKTDKKVGKLAEAKPIDSIGSSMKMP